jgi:long-chain acyl-CoA synthetase
MGYNVITREFSMEAKSSIAEVVKHLHTAYQNPKALNHYVDGIWVSTSTKEMLEAIEEITLGLVSLGIQKDQKVSIFAYPSPHWVIIDLAIMVAGAVSVPIFPNISEENLIFQIEQSEARWAFLGENVDHLYKEHKNLFTKIFCINDQSVEPNGMLLEDLKKLGREYKSKNPNKYQELLSSAKPDDVVTIIYTSGSTGVPKGVELTNYSLSSLISFKGFFWNPEEDRYLSLLPLAHVFGRMLNLCLVAWSISVYYLNDPKQIAQACKDCHPTIIVVVPRLLEKVYAKMLAKVESAGFLKRAIGQWAFDLANDEDDDSLLKQVLHPIADTIVYSSLREAFGGNVRLLISGGAPLNPHLAHFYIDIGIPVYEGWGLTEAGTVTVNRPNKRKVGTVGMPLEGMQIKLAADGEVLVKGPVVMKGYYKNEEANAKAFDSEGWLKTGDKGMIDEDGYLTLIGRLKELLKTSTGEYVVPVPLEQLLTKVPLVDMAMIIAERRKYTTCLLYPDLEILHRLKENRGQGNVSDEEFLNSEVVREEMQKAIDQINLHTNKAEKILDFRFVTTAPTVESGDLTPSMKIRREAVEKKYEELINSMYPENQTHSEESL